MPQLDALLLAQLAQVILVFAVDPQQIGLASHIFHAHPVLGREAMAGREGEQKALAIERLDD